MRALVTGVTGKAGHAVAHVLLAEGHGVRALVVEPPSARSDVPAGVEIVGGDVLDRSCVTSAVAGCDVVFNAMGIPEQWLRDPRDFDRVNAKGTETVVTAAREAGVRRVVHTSSVEVFAAPAGSSFDESAPTDAVKSTPYERSKQRAEQLALAAAGSMEVVIVNPVAIYGPGPTGSASLETALFAPLIRGRLPILPPGGFALVLTDSLASAQLLAAQHGRPGERYIISDGHLSIRALAELVVELAGHGRVPPSAPPLLARVLAAAGETAARVPGVRPPISRGQVHSLLWNPRPRTSKAERELGWRPVDIADGLRTTLAAYGLL